MLHLHCRAPGGSASILWTRDWQPLSMDSLWGTWVAASHGGTVSPVVNKASGSRKDAPVQGIILRQSQPGPLANPTELPGRGQ